MTTSIRRAAIAAAATITLVLTACATKGPATMHFDFGPLQASQLTVANVGMIDAVIVADVTGPAALDSERMQYRLLYADAREARLYAYNQWTSTPPQLLTQRIKARMAQAGVQVLSTTDAAASATVLRIEVEDFIQNFDSATSSRGVLRLRASVFRNHKLAAQKVIERSVPAPTPDAAGGARALGEASDAIVSDVIGLLATLPPSK